MQNEQLKVKIESLAAEARIIRRREKALMRKARLAAAYKKANPEADDYAAQMYSTFESIKNHRTNEVRKETRAAHLAYGFLRGVPYRAMELKPHEMPNFSRVLRLASSFSAIYGSALGHNSQADLVSRFEAWTQVPPTDEMFRQYHDARANYMSNAGKTFVVGEGWVKLDSPVESN